jgi:NAD(P)-dependent dehydrogenase (short-subunit alcohol dehydrogenase family)
VAREGAAIVTRLREAGAQVMTTARSMPDDYPEPDLFVAADAGISEGASRVVDAVQEIFGHLDILVDVLGGAARKGCG